MPVRSFVARRFSKQNVQHYARRLAKETGLPYRTVKKVLDHGWSKVLRAIQRGEEVRIKGFGTFYVQKRQHKYHDPHAQDEF